jgi:transposase
MQNTLKHRFQHEHDGREKPRLQMLDLLASGQAYTRQQVAQLLGVHRNTMGRWLALYESGGLHAWLALYVPAGQPSWLPSDVLTALERVLRQPTGFTSYVARRQWSKQTHHLDVNYHPLYTIVRTRFKTKLKGPRPGHTKTLMPYGSFRRPVRSGCSASFLQRIPGRRASLARTNAG